MMRFMRIGILYVLALLAWAPGAWAQTQITTGVIQGTVMDESGAVVSGAEVEVRNIDTNLARTMTTSDDGRFVFLQLPPGPYEVTVSQPGFATLVQENLTLTVGKAFTLNLTLKVSQIQERIVVTATPTVDTVKTESSSTLNELSVENTPVLGRKFEDLFTLTPGVSIVQGPDGDEMTFAGQRGIFNNFSLDGGDFNNGFFGEQAGGQRPAIDITLEAVKEFQVIATGASAEFGRTAGGVVNVITKSGTNEPHGSIFYFQRKEDLSRNTSTGEPLTDFSREQFGATIGGPIVQDKAFFFGAFEQITAELQRANLSVPIGEPCPVQAPTILADEALINSSPDCQRLALINFFRTNFNQEEGAPVQHPIRNSAVLLKLDWNVTPMNQFSFSLNFDRSKNVNQTFDVATYGNSANGIEGAARIQNYNFTLLSTLTPTIVNEAHFTYARENRPRQAVRSNVPQDVGIGFAPSFRFGNPFFLQPDIDELLWRTQIKDNLSIVSGQHTIKFGGEWLHTNNGQIFRGFFTGRSLFDSVTGFLHYATDPNDVPADRRSEFGPNSGRCADGSFGGIDAGCVTPLLLYLQGAGLRGPATDAAGASEITNEDVALFVQDKWQVAPNFTFNFGLRWEAQYLADIVVPPSQTAFGQFLDDPRFPSDGTIPDVTSMVQPRVGFAWDIASNQKSVLRASWGIYNARQNMLSQVGSVTTNGVQQQTIAGGLFANPTVRPTFPGLAPIPTVPEGEFPLFTGVRVFAKDYTNPRIYTTNVAFEQQLVPDLAIYFDFTWSKGVHLTRFINVNRGDRGSPFSPQLGEVMVTTSNGKSLYRGFTIGMRKRFSRGFQMEWNYVVSKDLDDDSNERDPFTDRSFDASDLNKDYSLSDRDIRHKFNLFMFAELPGGFQGNVRIQGRSAQPITPDPRVLNGVDRGRNSIRKNNEFFSLDWRLSRPFRWGSDGRYAMTPMIEMFNTTDNDNNINPLTTPGLFNFDGFLRQGVGEPLQVQLAVKFTF